MRTQCCRQLTTSQPITAPQSLNVSGQIWEALPGVEIKYDGTKAVAFGFNTKMVGQQHLDCKTHN